jgi:hypothetical protein
VLRMSGMWAASKGGDGGVEVVGGVTLLVVVTAKGRLRSLKLESSKLCLRRSHVGVGGWRGLDVREFCSPYRYP